MGQNGGSLGQRSPRVSALMTKALTEVKHSTNPQAAESSRLFVWDL